MLEVQSRPTYQHDSSFSEHSFNDYFKTIELLEDIAITTAIMLFRGRAKCVEATHRATAMAVRASTEPEDATDPNEWEDKIISPTPPLHHFPKEYSTTSEPYRYNEVHVLMFVWQDDDLDCLREVQQLEGVFSKLYNFNTKISIIPSRRPYRHVKNEISRLIDILNRPDCLVIVYYSGHGHLLQYGNLAWSPYEEPKNSYTEIPGLQWSSLQEQLELSSADVLIILDCCESGGSLQSYHPSPPTSGANGNLLSKPGTTELIAAAPFDTVAPGPGETSFTAALITELKILAEEGELFSVVELHRKVLANIIKQRISLTRENETAWYPSVSPVYARIVGGTEVPSIGLMPLSLGVGVGFGEGYWRVKEHEGEQILIVERQNERLGLSGWRGKLWSGGLNAGVEWQSASPEIVAWNQGKQSISLWRSGDWLRGLVLGVPSL